MMHFSTYSSVYRGVSVYVYGWVCGWIGERVYVYVCN